MKRLLFVTLAALALILGTAGYANAGSPHFVGAVKAFVSGDSVTVVGKEAGLGDETQIHIEVTGDAQCVNPGGNNPQAGNKESFSAGGDFPVQNGKALFSVTLTADMDPDCSPPMSVVWSNVVVTDAANGLSAVVIP